MKQAGVKNGAGLCKRLVMQGNRHNFAEPVLRSKKCLNDLANAKEDMLS